MTDKQAEQCWKCGDLDPTGHAKCNVPAGGVSVHFSSATDLWATPQDFFDGYNAKFGFQLDVCATP